jgi:RNase P/RNase MRP subunit p29
MRPRVQDERKRTVLVAEHKERETVPKDEKVVGFNAQADQYGFTGFFLLSDVQDEALRAELIWPRPHAKGC